MKLVLKLSSIPVVVTIEGEDKYVGKMASLASDAIIRLDKIYREAQVQQLKFPVKMKTDGVQKET